MRSGSSPLARGTLQGVKQNWDVARFIPTRAGNTRPYCRGQLYTAVHPHSRGEHSYHQCNTLAACGSSPLARGTLCSPENLPVTRRFIPTRAGNTHTPDPSRVGSPVHPHSRGEHITCRDHIVVNSGSSPLARGTHFFHHIDLPGKSVAPRIYQLVLTQAPPHEDCSF